MSGLSQGCLPSEPIGDDVEHPTGVVHVILVRGDNELPGVPGGVGCRNTEGLQQPFFAVGAVIGEVLPDHLREHSTRRPA